MKERRVIDHWSNIKIVIDSICSEYDTKWQRRSRVLNSKLIVLMIFKIILSARRQGLAINLTEFWEGCDDKNIVLPQSQSVSASSFCEARQKLSEEIFKDLNRAFLKNLDKTRPHPLWKGHHLYATDGSRVNIPRELTKAGFKIYDETRRHYPQGLLSCLYDVLNKTVYDFDFVSHMNERHCALEHLKILKPNDVLLFDRGYFSYLLLHEFHKKGVHAIFRLQEGSVNKRIEEFIASSKTDEIIEYIPSAAVISDLKKQGYTLKPMPISLRLIKQTLNGETYLYGTTLMGPEYPVDCFCEIYHERWSIEELYKISKNIVDIEEFHSKTERGVKQEIYAHLLLVNLARFFEFDVQDGLPPMSSTDKEKCQSVDFYKFFNPASMFNINFKNCIMIAGRYMANLFLGTHADLTSWMQKVLSTILRVRQKIRPGRSYPRQSFNPDRSWGKKGKSASVLY